MLWLSFREEASIWKEKAITLYLFKRNLHRLGYPLLIRRGPACLFLRRARGKEMQCVFLYNVTLYLAQIMKI
jgi:hypothetical protein